MTENGICDKLSSWKWVFERRPIFLYQSRSWYYEILYQATVKQRLKNPTISHNFSHEKTEVFTLKTPAFVLGRHCDSGSTLFSQRAFYYEAVRFVSDIWKCTNFIFLLRLSVKQKKFVVLYPMAEDYRYDIFFSFLINLYRWHIASIHQPIFLIISSLLFILWIQDKTYKYILKAWVW